MDRFKAATLQGCKAPIYAPCSLPSCRIGMKAREIRENVDFKPFSGLMTVIKPSRSKAARFQGCKAPIYASCSLPSCHVKEHVYG
ncbi:MAG: hypothetical protein LBS19_07235 [Clostridiales bacterium]|jgi:hypothetical protein|nr:hypothetical protein [Clostridiales bacterium]